MACIHTEKGFSLGKLAFQFQQCVQGLKATFVSDDEMTYHKYFHVSISLSD